VKHALIIYHIVVPNTNDNYSMPLYSGRDLDDWSGKRTVKTGQVRSNLSAASTSRGSEDALPSSSPFRSSANQFSKGVLLDSSQSKESTESSTKSEGSSADPSTDENSTIVLAENNYETQGGMIQPRVIPPAESNCTDDEDSTVLATLDEYSIEDAYFGASCMDCNDLNIEIDPETVDSEAIDYWQRVKANRNKHQWPTYRDSSHGHTHQFGHHQRRHSWAAGSGSGSGSSSCASISESEGFDNIQIEVVHQERKSDGNEAAPKSSSIRRAVKAISNKSSKTLKAFRDDYNAFTSQKDTAETTCHDDKPSGGCEVELKSRKQPHLMKLAKAISKSKLVSKMQYPPSPNDEAARDVSCASSTESLYGQFEDKYQIPDATSQAGDCESKSTSAENEKPDESMGVETCMEDSSTNSILEASSEHKKMTKKSHPSVHLITTVPMMRVATADPSTISGSESCGRTGECEASTNSEPETADLQTTVKASPKHLLAVITKNTRMRQLGRGIKKGVVRLHKLSTKKSAKDTNLVVCIDGKGDRLSSRQSQSGPNDEASKNDCDDKGEDEPAVDAASRDEVVSSLSCVCSRICQ